MDERFVNFLNIQFSLLSIYVSHCIVAQKIRNKIYMEFIWTVKSINVLNFYFKVLI